MKFVDLKMTEPEAKADSPMAEPVGERYPYGMCLYLDSLTLEKMGMTAGDFTVGDEFAVMGMARCTGTSMREREGGESYSTVDLQITEVALVEEEESAAQEAKEMASTVGGRLYGED